MSNTRVNKLALMCAASAIALTTSAAHAQQTAQNTESVTVTGSRIISDITLSPTPITTVSADQLQATTPTDIPDALNKLPDFIGGASPRSQNNGQNNNSGNTLSLRNLGPQRTLILLDGQRVAPSNRDGTVNVDALPQMLMSRVDVVTGGASAVYGSDAIGGVVLVDPPELRREPGENGEIHLIGTSNGRGGTVAGRLQAVLEQA